MPSLVNLANSPIGRDTKESQTIGMFTHSLNGSQKLLIFALFNCFRNGRAKSVSRYKRAIGNEFTIAAFLADVLNHGLKHPPLLSIGGNTGTINSFAGVDPGDLTGGVFTSANLLQGNNLACFLLQVSQTETPDVLAGLLSNVASLIKPLTDVVSQSLQGLNCPKLIKIDKNQFKKFPGYAK